MNFSGRQEGKSLIQQATITNAINRGKKIAVFTNDQAYTVRQIIKNNDNVLCEIVGNNMVIPHKRKNK